MVDGTAIRIIQYVCCVIVGHAQISNATRLIQHLHRQGSPPWPQTDGVPLTESGVCHGVVMWMEYCLDRFTTVSCGPSTDGSISHHRQVGRLDFQGTYGALVIVMRLRARLTPLWCIWRRGAWSHEEQRVLVCVHV